MALAQETKNHIRTSVRSPSAAQEVIDNLEAVEGISAAELGAIDGVTLGTGAASKAMTLDASGDYFGPTTGTYVYGHTATLTVSDGDGATNLIPQHQILGTAKAGASLLLGSFNTTNDATVCPSVNLLKSGNAAIGSSTIVASGEVLGEINFFGDDGADYESCAVSVRGIVDTTPGAGDMPGRLAVFTSADGAETPLEKMRVTGAAATALVTIGVAGTSTASLVLSGATSGTVTISPLAAAGAYTLTLPPDNGDAGEQLQTDGNGVLTFEAAGSLRAAKHVLGVINDQADKALERIRNRNVYAFRYKSRDEQAERMPSLSDTKTEYHGIMADEYPELMHYEGRIFNPINAFGELALAVKALAGKLERIEAALA